jgi:enamine deaminase RidA (YjgF/YER057c/UK114 family)
MPRQYIKGEKPQRRAYSPAVITSGAGKIVWLAGVGATEDENGKPLVGDFEAQTRRTFDLMAKTMQEAGGSLADLVTMTVFILDVRHGDRFVEIRSEYFPAKNFPGSALITVAGFGEPEMMVEIQAIAVIE